MLRASDYTIYAELPGSDDVLLVHGYTATYDRVSGRVASWLRSRGSAAASDGGGAGEWSPSAPTIALLQRRGHLTTKTPEEERAFVSKYARALKRHHDRRTPNYVVMPTYDCNLRCRYCFQTELRSEASAAALRVMDRELVDRLFVAFKRIDAMHGHKPHPKQRRTLTLYGGEPLQRSTRAIVEYLLERGRAENAGMISAVSNCTELHLFEDLLGPDGIASIQVTFDGPPSEHDRRRVDAQGAGTWSRIVENVGMALAKGVHINARVNVDRRNVDGLGELAGHFVRLGWDRAKNFTSGAAAVHGAADRPSQIGSWGVTRALRGLQERDPSASVINPSYQSAKRSLSGVGVKTPMDALRHAFCGAHNTMYVFDAVGRIFACWERTGRDEEAIGRVGDDGTPSFDDAAIERWHGRSVLSNATCTGCAYVFWCGGGCVALAQQLHGSYLDNYCDGFQPRFKAQAAEAYLARGGVKPAAAFGCESP
jgi:uncharacterized protein